jgi:hypothetical protein
MTAISILAMAMVISLFGGYLDSPGEQRTSNGRANDLPNLQSQTNVTKRSS